MTRLQPQRYTWRRVGAAWVAEQRGRVEGYLRVEKVEHGGVSLEPRWFVWPYVAVWAVRSKRNAEWVGWWAISGDLPTDYATAEGEREVPDVLMRFAREWKAAATEMAEGRQREGCDIGLPGGEKELAPLLLGRAELLEKWSREMKGGGDEAVQVDGQST